MKEYPIIMSGNHPKLILNGSKTQTRRVIKPQPPIDTIIKEHSGVKGYWIPYTSDGRLMNSTQGSRKDDCGWYCPYGQVGDRLLIKETWATEKRYDHLKPSLIPDTAKIYYIDKVIHKAGGYSLFTEMGKVRPSMFMCLWMSRTRPGITEVRVERVEIISSADARAEGYLPSERGSETDNFHNAWDSLNAKRGFDWEVNPWVWCISFKVV